MNNCNRRLSAIWNKFISILMITPVSVSSSRIDINPTTMDFMFIIFCVLMLLLIYLCWNSTIGNHVMFSRRAFDLSSAVMWYQPCYWRILCMTWTTCIGMISVIHFTSDVHITYDWLFIFVPFIDSMSDLLMCTICQTPTHAQTIQETATIHWRLWQTNWFSITNWSTISMWNISIIFHQRLVELRKFFTDST